MASVHDCLSIFYFVIFGYFRIVQDFNGLTVFFACDHAGCLIIIQISIHKYAHTGIGNFDIVIYIHPVRCLCHTSCSVISGLVILYTECILVSLDILCFQSILLCSCRLFYRTGDIIRSVYGWFACCFIVSCYSIDSYRSLIPTAATAAVAGTDCNGILSTVIQDAGIQCIYIIYIPRIGSVIEADTLIVKVDTVGTDEFSIDIYFI